MRIVRLRYEGNIYFGVLNDSGVRLLSPESETGLKLTWNQVSILAQPVLPGKLICVGMNYRAHAIEMGSKLPEEPLIFLKPPSAIIGNKESIVCPKQSNNVHYEGELALVVSQRCRNISKEQAKDFILGWTCANDITARDLQKKDGLYARAKGFDTFCPIGPWIETSLNDLGNLSLKTLLNGQIKQDSSTSDMIFDPYYILSFISGIMTLEPGDVVLTGTPPGIGAISPGDVVQVEIEGLGCLINYVV
ncbi:MAG TPA: fumarylacetoacetate hydrolase family protein [Desulfohalobiaceae bacterium]|nr:fumarylacetoacetate hydrolase family protein [Desulfohalobiaceae bacterium]